MIFRGGPPVLPPNKKDEIILPIEDEPEVIDKTMNWRFQELMKAGFNARQSLTLASDRSVDLHEAVDLIKKCGDEYLAFRILA